MSFISWNVRGVNNPVTNYELRELLKAENAYIVGLIETKLCMTEKC